MGFGIIEKFLFLFHFERQPREKSNVFVFIRRSIKCRFTALGILLGLLLSLGALIPIIVVWQTSQKGIIKRYPIQRENLLLSFQEIPVHQ